MIENQFAETGLEPYGINLKVLSTVKSKELMTVTKESAKTEYLSKSRDLITLTVYEALFDRLDDEAKNMLTEMYLSGVSYDSEKDKVALEALNNYADYGRYKFPYGTECSCDRFHNRRYPSHKRIKPSFASLKE